MTRARDLGTLTGVLDIDGEEIANGNRIIVQYVDNIDTPRERVVEEFTAKVLYDSVRAAYFYKREEISARWGENVGYFNHRASKFKILKDKE